MIRLSKYVMLLFLAMLSCIDPYWPDVEDKESVLVVDGLVTDDADNQYVFLSLTAPVDSQKFIPVSDARVVVTDNLGNSTVFYEAEAGKYYPSNFSGIEGRSYMLTVTLPNNKEYVSDYQLLTGTDEFDSLYYKIEYKPTTDPLYDIQEAQFYIEGIPSGSETTYYIFQLVETYKFHVDLKLVYIHAGNGMEQVTDPPPMLCWKTSKIGGFYLYKSMALSDLPSTPLPLHFVTFDTKQFYERYSLLVKQIRVSEEIFDLYYQVNQQNNSGSLYAIQPYNIVGNLKSVTNSEEPVLGSFVVGGIKEKREYFSRPPNVTFTFTRCFGQTDGVGWIIRRGGSPESPLYFTIVDGAIAVARKKCFFCSANGGTTERPEFWEDY